MDVIGGCCGEGGSFRIHGYCRCEWMLLVSVNVVGWANVVGRDGCCLGWMLLIGGDVAAMVDVVGRGSCC